MESLTILDEKKLQLESKINELESKKNLQLDCDVIVSPIRELRLKKDNCKKASDIAWIIRNITFILALPCFIIPFNPTLLPLTLQYVFLVPAVIAGLSSVSAVTLMQFEKYYSVNIEKEQNKINKYYEILNNNKKINELKEELLIVNDLRRELRVLSINKENEVVSLIEVCEEKNHDLVNNSPKIKRMYIK